MNKRQKLKKKNAVEQSSATTDFQFNSDDDFQFNSDDDSESESASVGIAPVLNPESVSDDEAHANNANDSISNALAPPDQTNPSVTLRLYFSELLFIYFLLINLIACCFTGL